MVETACGLGSSGPTELEGVLWAFLQEYTLRILVALFLGLAPARGHRVESTLNNAKGLYPIIAEILAKIENNQGTYQFPVARFG